MGTEKQPTILVVDDIASNRTLVKEILKINDYHVLEAKDSDEAKSVAETHQGPINLLIADLVMPRVNGMELARFLRPKRPEMKVLYISGYNADVNVQIEVWDAEADFLPKPFSPNGLLQKVCDLLDPSMSDKDK
ncbi:MAG: response regulator [Fibrobacteres bacterium]|nr:response regulator [Fibrobacterota bacterium]